MITVKTTSRAKDRIKRNPAVTKEYNNVFKKDHNFYEK
jgi:hypothetical protein